MLSNKEIICPNNLLKIAKNKISKNSKKIFLLHQIHSNKFIFIDKNFRNNKKFYGAEAFIQSTSDLGGIYKIVVLFKIFPKYFRDVAYKFVALNRHRIFKKN